MHIEQKQTRQWQWRGKGKGEDNNKKTKGEENILFALLIYPVVLIFFPTLKWFRVYYFAKVAVASES